MTQRSLNSNFMFYEYEIWGPMRLPDLSKTTEPSINRGSLEVKLLGSCAVHVLSDDSQTTFFFLRHWTNIYHHLIKTLHWIFHSLSSCILSGKPSRGVLAFLEFLPVRLVIHVLKPELLSKAWTPPVVSLFSKKIIIIIIKYMSVLWHCLYYLIELFLGLYSKETCAPAHQEIWIKMFTAALFIKRQKMSNKSKYPSVVEWITKLSSTHKWNTTE